ncbi:SMCs flexible hinge [Pseudocohnilembus persalinus]|uniref:Structural maintenance of chromosomes protein n=1 Tax=Pseudocohnilembus persalinus TaxID=266149 RepID=A0A0V0QQP7_PSEPJ|nr:SMCs flexible hinge [Pseudocohnilembus persalinus]|eukprot:KRX04587.1 SMCs flexible hinge [Pseudocohnilembus persalinus]
MEIVDQGESQFNKSLDTNNLNNSTHNINGSQNSQYNKTTPFRTPSRLGRSLITPAKNRQRLMVERIVLQDFKSYAGQKIIGPFHKNFTSIVGPNGSGKSNLIESLLFVFGKRANWMRLKQLHQLIHNSGQANTPKKASVEVHFHEIIDKEGEEYDIVPNTSFTVRRTVHMSNQTTYEINRKQVKQEDVINLLKDKGIDLNNNRFLILQGEVEQISLMKPKSGDPDKPGLLEYLEDIIGSNQYKDKIEELDEQYEKDNELRREKGERMRITEQDLEKLNESKNIAVDYIRREKLIYQIQNILNQIFRFQANNEQIKAEQRIEAATTDMAETKKEFKQKIQENKTLLQAWQKKRSELEETRNLRNKCKQEFEKLQQRDTKIRADIKFETENQVKLENKREELEKEYSKIVDDEKEMKKELPEKEKQLEKLTKEKEEEEIKLRDMKNEIKANNKELVKKKNTIAGKLQPFNQKSQNIKQQQKIISDKINMLNSNDESGIQEQIQEQQNNIQKYLSEIEQSKQTVEQIGMAMQNMKQMKDGIYNEKQKIEQILDQKQREANEIQTIMDQSRHAAQENQQKNQIVAELMRAQANQELKGIHGRLGDLGAIDAEYDVAITNACGALDNIVCDTQNDGQSGIKYLRDRKFGRASFMPIKTLYNEWFAKSKQPFQAPPGSKRLFDLLKIQKEEYRPLFYFALRDTLVCQDIEQGTRIAYGQQRFRVVTLDGKLIEASGTMSGGGKPKRGGMKSSLQTGISSDELNRLRYKKDQLENEINELRRQVDVQVQKIREISQDEFNAQKVNKEQSQESEFKTQQIQDAEKKIQYLTKQLDQFGNSKQEIQQLEKELKNLQKQQADVEKQSAQLQQELNQVEQELQDQGGQELQSQEGFVNDLTKRHKKIEETVNSMHFKINNTKKTIARNEKECNDVKAKLQKVDKKIKSLKDEQTQIEEDAMNVLGRLKGAEESLAQMEEEQKSQDKEKEKLDKMIEEMKSRLAKLQQELENLRNQLKQHQNDYTKYDGKIKQIRHDYSSIIEGYEFLNELDEIANFSTDPEHDQQQKNEQQAMEIEENEESNQIDETQIQQQQQSNQKNKKRMALGQDQSKYLQKDVTDDLSQEELEQIQRYTENYNYKLRNEESKLANLKSETNINTIQEFKKKYSDYKQKKEEFEKVKNRLAVIRVEIDKLKRQRFDEFMSGFNTISQKLKETYQTLTQGGDAELELIDSLDPFSDGVNFTVRPPKKSWKQISKLSGGEKTLSSLSLIFALHYYKPTPLYFMDEIDAALDFKNVSVVGHYVKNRTKDAQFIIISLRNNMFELANKLVGVYKTFDQTKTIAIIPEKVQSNLEKLKQSREDKENDQNEVNYEKQKKVNPDMLMKL